MAPEAKKSAAFGSIKDAGIWLPGKGAPGVRPNAVYLAFCAGSLVLGTVMGVLRALKSPLRWACGTALAVMVLAVTNLRHSWFQKKNVFLRSRLYFFGMNAGPPMLKPNTLYRSSGIGLPALFAKKLLAS